MPRGREKMQDDLRKDSKVMLRCTELFKTKLILHTINKKIGISKYIRGLVEADMKTEGD